MMQRRNTMMTSMFVIVLSFVFVFVDASSYQYLGCYKDSPTSPDISGPRISLPGMTSAYNCIKQCKSSGFAYAGLQLGSVCYCGNSYGMLGPSVDCNTTCGQNYCGGYLANDVYYSPDVTIAKSRAIILHATSELTFGQARSTCIMAEGDLAATESSSIISYIALLASKANSPKAFSAVWIGLFRRSIYEWTNASTKAYFNNHLAATQWDPSDQQMKMCVFLNVTTLLWQSADCSTRLPFVCSQIPPKIDVADNETAQEEDVTDDDSDAVSDGQMVAMMVVLPLFLFCYCGSCVAYCIYKIYRNFSRQVLQNRFNKMHPCVAKPTPAYPIPVDLFRKKVAPYQPSEYVNEPLNKFGDCGQSTPRASTSTSFTLDVEDSDNESSSPEGATGGASPTDDKERPRTGHPSRPTTAANPDSAPSTSSATEPSGGDEEQNEGDLPESINSILEKKLARKNTQH